MEQGELKDILLDQRKRFLGPTDLIAREALKEARLYYDQKEVVFITGIRRSGKSSLMKLMCKDFLEKERLSPDNVLYFNFEDERLIHFTHRDFEVLYEVYLELLQPKGKKYFFLDEIQHVKGWERWINRLYESEDVKVFLTGSNEALLNPEVATVLTGRHREVVIYPFSFREFLLWKGGSFEVQNLLVREGRAQTKHLLHEYIKLGGFPEVVKTGDVTLLEQYFRDIIYRDVIVRYKIRDVRGVRELALYLLSNIATSPSYERLRGMIHVKSLMTVKRYLEILQDVYLFLKADLFDYSIARQIYNPSRMYAIDVGFVQVLAFRFSENLGHIYENIVFIELLRRKGEIYYWRSKKGKEIDFLVKKGLHIESAIQVSLSLRDPETRKREMESLKAILLELEVKDLIIITEEEEAEEVIEGAKVQIVPLWKWLCESK